VPAPQNHSSTDATRLREIFERLDGALSSPTVLHVRPPPDRAQTVPPRMLRPYELIGFRPDERFAD